MENLIIYGNGRIAKIVYHYLRNNYNVVGFTVEKDFIKDTEIESLPLVAFEEVESIFSPLSHKMIVLVGYIEMNEIRTSKYLEGKNKGYKFVNYIHPSVARFSNVVIGENNVVLDHVSLQPFSQLGNSNFLWSNCVVAHGSNVGDGNWITSGVVISGDATLGSNCFLGVNSTIGHNVKIGNSCFVGANTLISKNINDDEVHISRDGEKYRLDSKRFLKFAGV